METASFKVAVFQSGTRKTGAVFIIYSKGSMVKSPLSQETEAMTKTQYIGGTPRAFPAGVKKRNPDAQVVIHPRSNTVLSSNDEWTQRDIHVHKIRSDGVETWRRESGYYRQSTVENTFYRYKTSMGRKLRARDENARLVEVTLGCKILNRCLELGGPVSVRVG